MGALRRFLTILPAFLLALASPVVSAQDAASNLAVVIVSTGYGSSDTSIVLTTGHAARLPAAPFNCSYFQATDYPGGLNSSGTIDPKYEVVRATAVNTGTDTLTVVRGQEGTTASTKNDVGKTYVMQCGLTAARFTSLNDAIASPIVTVGAASGLANERALTGTSNQITVTDNGAGSSVVLSTPQNLHTAATPTFGGLTLSNLTSGRVPYASTGGLFADDAELFWDATNNVLKLSSAWGMTRDALGLQIQRTVTTPLDTTPGAVRPIFAVRGTFAGSGRVNQGRIGMYSYVEDDASVRNVTISNAVDEDGAGAGTEIRLTATGHGFSTGDTVNVYGVVGTTEANNAWTITVIDANTIDLQGSTFTNAYVSGGTITNRGLMYALSLDVKPIIDRDTFLLQNNGQNGDDVAGLTISNSGTTSTATDAIWMTDGGTALRKAWHSIIASDSGANRFISWTGKAYLAGIDVSDATLDSASVPMFKLGSGHNFELDSAGNGTKFGTATGQKIGFFNATPIAQPSSTTELKDGVLGGLGLMATGGAASLDLDGGSLTAQDATLAGKTINTDADATVAALSSSATFTKNDTNTRAFSVAQIKPTLNFGGSNDNTIVNVLNIDTTNTSTTGLSPESSTRGLNLLLASSGGVEKFRVTNSGGATVTAAGTDSAGFSLRAHSASTTANTSIATVTAAVSAGTAADPKRTQGGQTILRTSAFGYHAGDDTTTATISSSHRAAVDLVAGANDWTSTDNGTFIRVRTTATGGTTTNAKAFISEQGLELSTGNAAPTARGTTNGTNTLRLFNGTAPDGTLANGIDHYAASGEARTKDAAGVEQMLTPHNKALTDNSATSVLSLSVASLAAIGGTLTYTIEATDGTDVQMETGQVVWSGVNKAGTITAAVTEINTQQSLSAGTLTTAWTISAANPAVISVNANTSLTPSGGYPRITFRIENLGRQAFTLP